MLISMDDFDKYALEFLGCRKCDREYLKDDKCWDTCVKVWVNAEVKKKDDRCSE